MADRIVRRRRTRSSAIPASNASASSHGDSGERASVRGWNAWRGASPPFPASLAMSLGSAGISAVTRAHGRDNAATKRTKSFLIARSPTGVTGTATERTHPSPLDLSIAAGSPSIQRPMTSAPRNESAGNVHRRSNGATTAMPPAVTPPTVSMAEREAGSGLREAGNGSRVTGNGLRVTGSGSREAGHSMTGLLETPPAFETVLDDERL